MGCANVKAVQSVANEMERIKKLMSNETAYSIKFKERKISNCKSTPCIKLCSSKAMGKSQSTANACKVLKQQRESSNTEKSGVTNVIRQRKSTIKSSNYYAYNFSLNPKNDMQKTGDLLISSLMNTERVKEETEKLIKNLPRFVKQETRVHSFPMIRATRRSEPVLTKDKPEIILRSNDYKDSSIARAMGKLDEVMGRLRNIKLVSLDINNINIK
eukprot:TRINITY_DN3599_c0_g7_i2.p1 TRINITY_DN3599_c0_g7~~TRINITY_DN3599_c0_g7_i2.p1  ORF type:complete len:215 (+),score=19.05 TRINITY_DN3599_c0_g7_i2:440-1084(+)